MTQQEILQIYGKPHFVEIKSDDMLNMLGEDTVKSILSRFSCPLNKDVQEFLKTKAIPFSKRNFSKTTLVYWESADCSCKEQAGYYTIASKFIKIPKSSLNSKERHIIYGHGTYNHQTKEYEIPAPLIAQLGKNYSHGNDTIISGDELLALAMQKIKIMKLVKKGTSLLVIYKGFMIPCV